MLSRRTILAGLPLFAWRAWPAVAAFAAAGARRVLVVFSSAVEPCAAAAEGLRARLLSDAIWLDFVDLACAAFAADVAQELARRPVLIVAVGSDALRYLAGKTAAASTISTMTLAADRAPEPSPAPVHAAIYLDIPVRLLVAELHNLFPGKPRIAVIRNPNRPGPSAALPHGIGTDASAVEIAECDAPEKLLPVFLGLRKKADFVICLPDAALYNGATARPLIMASLENRLPIVGFSPAFLRAGAAVAVYPDYRAIGYQTADLVRRCLEPGGCAGTENPRKIQVAVNAKILRMLGMEFSAADHPEVEVLR